MKATLSPVKFSLWRGIMQQAYGRFMFGCNDCLGGL